ncbi:hypothetical protein V4U86_20865 [Mycobacterium sp. AMU20-3851]|uniref:hypothetical protein n=1 Tax=Mycobacterium sp. AMU20-3851 TaxID=3122055 RepID=UPI003754FC7E
MAGPFVGYLCSNEITVTMSLPLQVHGRFSGVMCADVLVSSLENVLLPDHPDIGCSTMYLATQRGARYCPGVTRDERGVVHIAASDARRVNAAVIAEGAYGPTPRQTVCSAHTD